MSESRHLLCRAAFAVPLAAPDRTVRHRDGYVLAKGDRIVEVGPWTADVEARMRALGDDVRVIGRGGPLAAGGLYGTPAQGDFPCLNGVLLPAFVKAHGHDHEQPLIGIAKNEPLTHWLDNAVNPFTRFINGHRDELTALLGRSPNLLTYQMARLVDIHYGITSALAHHCNFNKYHLEEIAQANEAAGTTILVAVGGQDRFYFAELLDKPADALARLDGALEIQARCARTTFCPGPDQLFSNSRDVLVPQKAWARAHGTIFHTHSAEEPNTTRWFSREIEPGLTEVEYAEQIGILDERTLLAHQVNCGPRDLEILARTGTRIVHNPLANTILGSGMPPVVEMIAQGIPLAISTDGSGSADNQNILAAARLASQYQKARHQNATLLPSQDVLERITSVPAAMLGFDQGELAPGRQADWVLLSLDRPNLVPTRLDNVVENLIWAADGSEVDTVVARGRILKKDGRVLPFLDGTEPSEILAKVQVLSERFARYMETAERLYGTGAHQV